MSKVLGSWSGMRKYLEKEMLEKTLQGRVRYNCTRYVGMDDCHIFEVYLDDKKVKQFSLETVNSYFINSELKENKNPYGMPEYWEEFWSLLDAIPMSERSAYTDLEFCEALDVYRNHSIEDSIQSENPLVRMFAILDRRIGKKTLIKLKEKIEIQPKWLQQFYLARIEADHV